MKFLAVTQPTATWLLSRTEILTGIAESLQILEKSQALQQSVFIAGSLRFAATDDGAIVAFWNTDYLNATGVENWGFLTLSGRHGAINSDQREEMFRTSLIVFDTRLQNLLSLRACIFVHIPIRFLHLP